MKKLMPFLFFIIMFFPNHANAALNVLNGFSANQQFLVTPTGANSMHMEILDTGGDTHRFRWDGTPWRVDQGGLGVTTTPPFGFIPMGTGTGYSLVSTSSLGIIPIAQGINGALQFNKNGLVSGASVIFYEQDAENFILATPDQTIDDSAAPTLNILTGKSKGTANGIAASVMGARADLVGNGGDMILAGGRAGTVSGHAGNVLLRGGGVDSGDGGSIFAIPSKAFGSGVNDGRFCVSQPDTQPTNICFDTSAIAGNIIGKFQSVSGTFGLLEADQLWSGANIFSRGSSATTTVSFGSIGDTSSRACFNTKNTNGDDISFYFSGVSMIVENNPCQ